MVASDVYGLDRFSEYMEGLEDCYTVIGGAACSIILSNADLDFRATKDIDLILLIENRFPESAAAVWKLVRDGGYTCGRGSSGDVHFYRFTKPSVAGFPSMIELFSKAPSFIQEPEGLTIVPLPAGDETSSLSAILLDEDYYAYMKSGRKTINGITVLDEVHLVPFKAKAFLDLSKRKAEGEKKTQVISRNIRRMFSDCHSSSQWTHCPCCPNQYRRIWQSSARQSRSRASR